MSREASSQTDATGADRQAHGRTESKQMGQKNVKTAGAAGEDNNASTRPRHEPDDLRREALFPECAVTPTADGSQVAYFIKTSGGNLTLLRLTPPGLTEHTSPL